MKRKAFFAIMAHSMDVSPLENDLRTAEANCVTWLSIGVNTVLIIGKLLAGIIGCSAAMIADAVHSASDLMTDIAVLIGMKLANRPEDEDHPYGHGKYETLAAVIIGSVLLGVGLLIIYQAGHTLWHAFHDHRLPHPPALLALWAGLLSIVVKEALYQVTARVARRTQNDALLANAWHHRSDAFSSIGTSIGVGAAALFGGKWALLDPIAAILVGLLLVKIAWNILHDSVDKLLEQGMSPAENARILDLTRQVPGLSDPHELRSRRVGTVAVIEMHFYVPPEMTVQESHDITMQVEHTLRADFGQSAILTIHVEPLPHL